MNTGQKIRAFRRWAGDYIEGQYESDEMAYAMDGSGECGWMIRQNSIIHARKSIKKICRKLEIKPNHLLRQLGRIVGKEKPEIDFLGNMNPPKSYYEHSWLSEMLKADYRPRPMPRHRF